MRFGLSTAPQNCTWEQVLALWKAADDMEVFESAWTFDHFYPIFSDPTGPCLEGWSDAGGAPQATTPAAGWVMVTGMVYRHPAVLANMAATARRPERAAASSSASARHGTRRSATPTASASAP